jgi:hypothetical protein
MTRFDISWNLFLYQSVMTLFERHRLGRKGFIALPSYIFVPALHEVVGYRLVNAKRYIRSSLRCRVLQV